jgi:hypothetical protein
LSTRSFRAEIFLVSLAAILLEIGYTRIFSYKVHYYFTYLIIGISLLGLGSGGVFVAVMPWLRRVRPERLVAVCSLAAAAAVPVAYLVVARVQLNAAQIADSVVEFATLVLLCSMVFLPFLLVGIMLATIFASRPSDIARLYFADLLGAGIGCALCIPLFATLSPPGAIILAGAVLGVGGVIADRRSWRIGSLAGGVLIAVCLLGTIFHRRLPDPVVAASKTNSPQWLKGVTHEFTRWSSTFRIDVVGPGSAPDGRKIIAHDGNAGSSLVEFDGDFASVSYLDTDVRATPFAVLAPNPKVLIIGAAGGHEVLASLYHGAREITAVELNPVTVELTRGPYADYTGRIAYDPRVTWINGEGRSFIQRSEEKYDLIWFVAPDSYAAMNAASSGAFVLSESYLYTKQMIKEAIAHLTPGGLICLQTGDVDYWHKPNRAGRFLSTARAALADEAMKPFAHHVMVSSVPELFTMVTILISAQPISEERVARFREIVSKVHSLGRESKLWHPLPPGTPVLHPVQVITTFNDELWKQWLDEWPYDLSPVSDDKPFFWHFTSFRRAVTGTHDEGDEIFDPEDSKGERVLVALLVFVVSYAAVFLILPLLMIRVTWRQIPYKRFAFLYFAALGLGFMFYEIVLIQKLTLFLGYPTYSLTVTIFALLIFSGLGSLASDRYSSTRNRTLTGLLAVLVVLTVFYQFGVGLIVDSWGGISLGLRVAVSVAMLAPLGHCLGAFMPIGLRAVAGVSEHAREFVAWAWAVNGFFSVVSSVAATMLSMTFGFGTVLYLALGIYAVGIAAMRRIPQG